MTRDEARARAHKLLGKWADLWCEVQDGEEFHAQACDTLTDNLTKVLLVIEPGELCACARGCDKPPAPGLLMCASCNEGGHFARCPACKGDGGFAAVPPDVIAS